MAKVRLLVWLMVVGATGVLLGRGVRWSGDDPAIAVMAVVRVVGAVLAAYLVVATLAAIGRVPLPSPVFVRRLVAAAVGGGLLVAPMSAGASSTEPTPVEAPVLRRVSERPAPERAPAPAPPVPSAHVATTVQVVSGDHLWSIAQRALTERLGRPATDDEVGPYWRAVMDANRGRLRSGDPSLIFPGETVVLP